MFLLILPVLLGFMGLVIDGAHAFGEKRKSQNLADATALAAAQSILGPAGECPTGPAPITSVKKAAECYSEMNGGPSVLHECDYSDPANPERPDPGDGCYAWPYKGDSNRVEIRVTRSVGGFFLSAIGLGSIFDNGAFARAVASVATEPHCIIGGVERDDLLPDCKLPDEPGTFVPGDNADHCYIGDPPELRDDLLPGCQLPDEPGTIVNANGVDHCYVGDPLVQRDDLLPSCVLPGDTGTVSAATSPHCTFGSPVTNPDQYVPDCAYPGVFVDGSDGGVGFAKSTNCQFDTGGSAITYGGAGGGEIGALTTNGGITISGNGGKTITSLGLGRNGERNKQGKPCYDNSGAGTILNPPIKGPWSPPLDWIQPLPPIPTPGSGCTDLGSADVTFTTAGHPPGVYCVTGTTATLFLSALDLSAGYTFFAPNITVSGGIYKCYALCASTPGRNATLFYATVGDVKSQGNAPNLTGNIFAPNGEISFTGGGVNGGRGYLEAQTLKLAGNFANYLGTGPGPGGHFEGGQTGTYVPGESEHCYIGDQQRDDLLPDCRLPDETGTIVPGDHSDHCYVGDPPVLRDDLLPSCVLAGDPGTIIHGDGLDHCYIGDPPVQRDDLLPDCVLYGETGIITSSAGPISMDE